MSDPPRLLSTQHPDNASPPPFSESDLLGPAAEIEEAHHAFAELGCDEQLWDFEGKEGDEYVVQKLLAGYESYFRDSRLGEDVRLTLRGPNPAVADSASKVLLEILESIPRSNDAAAVFAAEHDLPTVAPIQEVIVPMVTEASQVIAVDRYYEQFVTGKADREVAPGMTVGDWVGRFEPARVRAIPLIETRDAMVRAHEIVAEYAEATGRRSIRVFLARSDPALNYGCLAADLINKIALARLEEMARDRKLEIHPMLGAGSSPFRGHLTPETVERILAAYPTVQTFTIQSAFKYDHPPATVRAGLETLREATVSEHATLVDHDRASAIVDRTAAVYGEQIDRLAPLVNRLSELVPRRRARKLHVGLFGYSREVGEHRLPRAIGFTAACYSIGLPPTLLGLAGLTDSDVEFLERVFPQFFETLAAAARYYNPRCHELCELRSARLEAGLEYVDSQPDGEHRTATDEVISAVQAGDEQRASAAVAQAARLRRFLG
jgi:phosphoenolpyruvate carboxylase